MADIAAAVSNVSSNSDDVVAVAGALSDVNTVAGVAAAVVGIIAATFFQIGYATIGRIPSLPLAALLFAVGLFMVWRLKGAWVTPAIVTLGALAGWLMLG